MNNSNTNNSGDFEVSNYLVTEGVNPKKIDPIQQGMDLSCYRKLRRNNKIDRAFQKEWGVKR
jgi:hypothetical protein